MSIRERATNVPMGAIDAAWRRNKTLLRLAYFRYRRKANPRVSGTPTLDAAQSAVRTRLLLAGSKNGFLRVRQEKAMASLD